MSTWLVWLRVHVSPCLVCLRAYVPRRHEFLTACVSTICVLMYSHVNMPCKLTCSRANIPWVPCLTWFTWPRDHLPTCLPSSVSSFDTTFFSFAATALDVVRTVIFKNLISVFLHKDEFVKKPSKFVFAKKNTKKKKKIHGKTKVQNTIRFWRKNSSLVSMLRKI